MDILLNELSLDKQFSNLEALENSLIKETLPILKEMHHLSFCLMKKSDFYERMATFDKTIYDILKTKQRDSITKFKSLLFNMLLKEPFWEEDKKHNDDDSYFYKNKSVNNTSLAEASERDKLILSFQHKDFREKIFAVLKNGSDIDIYNICKPEYFFDLLQDREILSFEELVKKRFVNTNLDFSEIDKSSGFNIVRSSDERVFFKTFKKFSGMDWQDILKDKGFDYKEFKDQNRFKDIPYRIDKFRVTKKYRCFGYRKNNYFCIIRFETDHKLSDRG